MEAPRHPIVPAEEKPFRLDFSVRESNEGTEEKPILYYERNGFIFKANLDLMQNSVDIEINTKRPESVEKDWQVLLPDVEALAKDELHARREKYSAYFS